MLKPIVDYLKFDIFPHLRELVIPIALFIDTYYRSEWFYLHTSWGNELLGSFFGGH